MRATAFGLVEFIPPFSKQFKASTGFAYAMNPSERSLKRDWPENLSERGRAENAANKFVNKKNNFVLPPV